MQQILPLEPRKSMTELLTTRIRATFGPLHLVSLYSGRWAAVWFELVPDEATAKVILLEDAAWFNVEPDAEGHCNPTFADKADALQDILRMLRDMHGDHPDARLHAAIEDAASELIYAREERLLSVSPASPLAAVPAVSPSALSEADVSVPHLLEAATAMDAVYAPTFAAVDEEVALPSSSLQPDVPHKAQPWEDLTDVKKTNLRYEMPPEVVAKMDWVIDNVPKMNRQRIVRDAVAAYLDRVISAHYKADC